MILWADSQPSRLRARPKSSRDGDFPARAAEGGRPYGETVLSAIEDGALDGPRGASRFFTPFSRLLLGGVLVCDEHFCYNAGKRCFREGER